MKKKLKDILKESNVWDRKFGESLPTLKDTAARYAAKQNITEKTGGEKTYKSLMSLEKCIQTLEKDFKRDERDMDDDRARNVKKSIANIKQSWTAIWADFQER